MDHFPLGDRSITSSSSIWPRTHSFSISTKNNVNVLQSPDIQSGGSLGERAEDTEDRKARVWGRAGQEGLGITASTFQELVRNSEHLWKIRGDTCLSDPQNSRN